MSRHVPPGSDEGRHDQPKSTDRMAIGFLAPQESDQSRNLPHPATIGSDPRHAPGPRPRLESFAYGVNVQASLSISPCGIAPNTLSYGSVPNYNSVQSTRPPSLCSSSQTSTPATSPDQTKYEDLDRSPRERRDPYSEEMQFFIMFARIIKEQDWRRIEDDFERIFNQRRPRDGLTAVYYRIRTRWGMQQVLKGGQERSKKDSDVVDSKARALPHEFLRQIGYLS